MLHEKLTFSFLIKGEEKEMKDIQGVSQHWDPLQKWTGGTKTMMKIRTNVYPIRLSFQSYSLFRVSIIRNCLPP